MTESLQVPIPFSGILHSVYSFRAQLTPYSLPVLV